MAAARLRFVHRSLALTSAWRLCLFLLLLALGTPQLYGQPIQQRTLPNLNYFATFQDFYRGEYNRAMRGFRSAARGGFTNVNGPWIDSVCYHAMIGECLYQMGDRRAALEQYNTAIGRFAANGPWLSRADFPNNVQPDSNAINQANITWGASRRNAVIGDFPDSIPVMIGNLDGINAQGVVQRAEFRPANIAEIMRCLTLALRRRVEILGPVAVYDPVTRQAVDALKNCGINRNSWARVWVDIPLGVAMVGDGDFEQAAQKLQSSLQVMGRMDHPLTAVALLELGKVYFRAEQYGQAAQLFSEATFSAAVYGHQAVLEEAFQWAANTHAAQKQGGVYPPLPAAFAWAQRDGSRQLVASLAMQLAEGHLLAGDVGSAQQLFGQASRAMRGNQISATPLGARLAFLQAHAAFQTGNVAAGINDLTAAMKLQQVHSQWLSYIRLADQFFVGGAIPERTAAKLFDELLRDPQAKDWRVDPLESLSVLLIPHPQALERWFEMAISRRDYEKAIEIADRIRRQRFYNALPLGGRLLALRWMLEAPRDALSEEALQQRQEFMLRYPGYAELSAQSTTILDRLRDLPLLPAPDDPARAAQKRLLSQLAGVSSTQEALLADIALRREPSEMSFPPVYPVAALRESLGPKQVVLAYFLTSRALYRFEVRKDEYKIEIVKRTATIRRDLAGLLRGIGNFDRNQPVDAEILVETSWKQAARELAATLLPSTQAADWADQEELIVVPDGILWYLPFELLQLTAEPADGLAAADDGEEPAGDAAAEDAADDDAKAAEEDEATTVSLVEQVHVRYLPTVSLVRPVPRAPQKARPLAVVTGQLFPRSDQQLANAVFADLQEEDAGAVQLQKVLPGPSNLLIALVDRLLVLDDLSDPQTGLFGLAPMQIDQGKAGSDLNAWMAFPFAGVEQVVLPGYHSAAETALRRRGADGSELFLTACGMMAAGSRTILLSRWRPGGQSSHELMREFTRELPRETASEAWRRSLDLLWRSELTPELEPRLKEAARDAALDPQHPFFWAGYLLIDTGLAPPPRPEAAEEEEAEAADDEDAAEPRKGGGEDKAIDDGEMEK